MDKGLFGNEHLPGGGFPLCGEGGGLRPWDEDDNHNDGDRAGRRPAGPRGALPARDTPFSITTTVFTVSGSVPEILNFTPSSALAVSNANADTVVKISFFMFLL